MSSIDDFKARVAGSGVFKRERKQSNAAAVSTSGIGEITRSPIQTYEQQDSSQLSTTVSMPRTRQRKADTGESTFSRLLNAGKSFIENRFPTLGKSAEPAPYTPLGAGEMNTREVLARIARTAGGDAQKAQELFSQYEAFAADPSTPVYNPYLKATNSEAISELSKLGVDVSGGINDEWFARNANLMNYYRTGTAGTPLAPASKSTSQQDAAYWYYKLAGAEETTKAAEAEWADMVSKINYWVDRGYSDEEVLKKVDLSNYKTLSRLEEAKAVGVPVQLNRAIEYSPDAVYGAIWAARNGGGSGNILSDMTNYALAAGNHYTDDGGRARRDPSSAEYNPYAGGTTMDDAAIYFGVDSFDADWLAQNRGLLSSGDDTAVKYYRAVAKAEETTAKAEEELALLTDMLSRYDGSRAPEEYLRSRLESLGDSSILAKMDAARALGGPVALTRSVDYRYEDALAGLQEKYDAVQADAQRMRNLAAELGGEYAQSDAERSIIGTLTDAIRQASGAIEKYGTEAEKQTWATDYAADSDAYTASLVAALASGTLTAQEAYTQSIATLDAAAADEYLPAVLAVKAYEEAQAEYEKNQMLEDERAMFATMPGLRQAAEEARLEEQRVAAEEAQTVIDRLNREYAIAERIRTEAGVSPAESLMSSLAYAENAEKAYTDWSNTETPLQAFAAAGNVTPEDVAVYAESSLAQAQADLIDVEATIEKLQGVAGSESFVVNLEKRKAQLEKQIRLIGYEQLPQTEGFAESSVAVEPILAEYLSGEFGSMSNGMYDFGASVDYQFGQLTDAERSTAIYLAQTQGMEAMNQYLDDMSQVLNARAMGATTAEAEAYAQNRPVLSTIDSVLSAPANAVGGALATLEGVLGEEIDPNAYGFAGGVEASTIRGTVKQAITDELGEDSAGAFWANLLYDAATSGADSLLSTAVAGPTGGLVMMGVNAGTSAVQDAKARGASDGQALLMGGATMASTIATERLPLDSLAKSFAAGGAAGVRGVLKSTLSGLVSDVPGEMLDELISGITDDRIMGELSRSEARVTYLVQGGMPEEAARKQAQKEALQDMLYAGLTAAVSTGASNVVSGAAGALAQNIADSVSMGRTIPETTEEELDTSQATRQAESTGPRTVEEPEPRAMEEPEPEVLNITPDMVSDAPRPEVSESDGAETAAPTHIVVFPEVASLPTAVRGYLGEGYTARAVDALLTAAYSSDAPSRVAVIEASLGEAYIPDSSVSMGKAAAMALETLYGRDSAVTLADMLAAVGDKIPEDLSRAIAVGTLVSDSAAREALDIIAYAGSRNLSDVNMLRMAAQSDWQKPSVMSAVRKAVLDVDVAERVKRAVASGSLIAATKSETAAFESARTAYESARNMWDTASAGLQRANEGLLEAQRAYDARPADTDLAEAVMAALDVKRQQQKQLDKANGKLKQAQSKYGVARSELESATETALNDLRAEALAAVKADRRTQEKKSASAAVTAQVEYDRNKSYRPSEPAPHTYEVEWIPPEPFYGSAAEDAPAGVSEDATTGASDDTARPTEAPTGHSTSGRQGSVAAEGPANRATPFERIVINPDVNKGGEKPAAAAAGQAMGTSAPVEPMPANSPEFEQWRAERAAKYGTIPQGEKTNRDPQMPKRTSDDLKLSQYVRTFMESDAYNAENAQAVQQAVMDGELSYVPVSDNRAQEYADSIMAGGIEAAQTAWETAINSKRRVTKKQIALGTELLKHAAENGDAAGTVQMLSELADLLHDAGQMVQAAQLLKRSGSVGMAYSLQRTVDKLNRDLATRRRNFTPISVPDELMSALAQAKTEADMDAATAAIVSYCADKIPPTWGGRLQAWRMMAMLGNVRTHVRNIAGNGVMLSVVKLKNAVAAGLEAAFGTAEKSKALRVDQKYKDFAAADYAEVAGALSGTDNSNLEQAILNQTRSFGKSKVGNALEWLSKKNSWALEKEDAIFLKNHYRRAMAQWLQANKVDLDDVPDKTLAKAREYATSEALRNTFRDNAALATWLQQASRQMSTPLGRAATHVFVEAVMPFKKTPMNILKRGVEYSPLGLIQYVRKASQHGWTSAQAIDALAAGLTGTGIAALGALLYSWGALKLGADDEKEEAFRELTGGQDYSIELDIGGTRWSYTIDWLTPVSMPLFVGAELMKALESDNEGLSFWELAESFESISEPIFNLSMLDGINDMLESVRYATSGNISGLLETAATSYLSQYVPTMLGAVARTVDPYRRMNYADKNSEVPASIQRAISKIQNKIPGASMQNSAYVNVWGEPDVTDMGQRIAENWVSPGYASEVEADAVETNLQGLYNLSRDSAILPSEAPKSFSAGGQSVQLTEEQYHDFAVQRGRMMHSLLDELFASPEYAALPTAQQVEAVKDVYDYATSIGKKTLVPAYSVDNWIRDAERANQPVQAILSRREADEEQAIIGGAYNGLADAVLGGDAEVCMDMLELLRETGKSNGSIKSALASRLESVYQAAYDAGDTDEMLAIEDGLLDLGIGFKQSDFDKWAEVEEYEG